VTPPLSVDRKAEPFWSWYATVSTDRNGKVAKRAGKPEDLPWQTATALRWDRDLANIPKKGQENWVQPFKPQQLEGFFIGIKGLGYRFFKQKC